MIKKISGNHFMTDTKLPRAGISISLCLLLAILCILPGPLTAVAQQAAPDKRMPAQESASQKVRTGKKVMLNFVTTPPGSPGYTLAVGQGNLLNKKLSNLNVVVQPSIGVQALPRQLAMGEAHMVTTTAITMYWAFWGEEDFTTPLKSLRLLQSGSDILFGFLTRGDTGVQSIEELKGRRVTYETPSATLITRLGALHLQAYGLDPKKDVTSLKAEFTTTALTNLMDKRTDAIMAALTGAKMAEAQTRIVLKVLPFAESKIPFLQKGLPLFYGTTTPTGLAGVTPNVPVVASANVLIANKEMDDDTAYAVTKTLVDNYKELLPMHPDFSGWAPERAVRDLRIPYHPGAIRYYREKGLWSNEMERKQVQLLGAAK